MFSSYTLISFFALAFIASATTLRVIYLRRESVIRAHALQALVLRARALR